MLALFLFKSFVISAESKVEWQIIVDFFTIESRTDLALSRQVSKIIWAFRMITSFDDYDESTIDWSVLVAFSIFELYIDLASLILVS